MEEEEGPHTNYLGAAGKCQLETDSASCPVVECRRPALEEEGPHTNYSGVDGKCQREVGTASCPVAECGRPALEVAALYFNYLGVTGECQVSNLRKLQYENDKSLSRLGTVIKLDRTGTSFGPENSSDNAGDGPVGKQL